jgi:SAM-dependent methyltransferase
MADSRQHAKKLAEEYLAKGDATGWFEELYRTASGDASAIPWADLKPNPNLIDWIVRRGLTGQDKKKAIVIGCGLGDDAEALAALGFDTVAFDISATAIDWAQNRFPRTKVRYCVADLFHPPAEWIRGFDLVLEAYTLQVLPPPVQKEAIPRISALVAKGGTLLVICRGRSNGEPYGGGLHWALSPEDMRRFEDCGLAVVSFEDYWDREQPPVRRLRVEYCAAQPAP